MSDSVIITGIICGTIIILATMAFADGVNERNSKKGK